MKIAVLAANGKAGRLITEEAVNRKIDVTAVVRKENNTKAEKTILKDIMDLNYEDLKDFDVIIDAFGAWTPETLPLHSTTLKHLCNILKDKPNRLLIVGGAGSLYTDKEHSKRLMDGEDFPEAFMPLASNMGKALDELRKVKDVNWTYISPAADFQADGERTGEYILSGEEFTTNAKGESIISYADYAIAMIDEATKGNHIKKRISVLGK